MRARLRVAACATPEGGMRLRIIEQTVRGAIFGDFRVADKARDVGMCQSRHGVVLCSDGAPGIMRENGQLWFFVQGREKSLDGRTVEVDLQEFSRIASALYEYNGGEIGINPIEYHVTSFPAWLGEEREATGFVVELESPYRVFSANDETEATAIAEQLGLDAWHHISAQGLVHLQQSMRVHTYARMPTLGDAASARSAAATRDALTHGHQQTGTTEASAAWDILLRLIKLGADSPVGREARGMVRELAHRLDHTEHEEVVRDAVAAFEGLLLEDPDMDAADALRDACDGRIGAASEEVFLRASPNQGAAELAFGEAAADWSDLDRATYALRHDVEAETGDLNLYAAKTCLRDYLRGLKDSEADAAEGDGNFESAVGLMATSGCSAAEAWASIIDDSEE